MKFRREMDAKTKARQKKQQTDLLIALAGAALITGGIEIWFVVNSNLWFSLIIFVVLFLVFFGAAIEYRAKDNQAYGTPKDDDE